MQNAWRCTPPDLVLNLPRILSQADSAHRATLFAVVTGPCAGLGVLRDLRHLKIIADGADAGSPLHGLFFAQWAVFDWSKGCLLDCIPSTTDASSTFAQGELGYEGRALISEAISNFDKTLEAICGASFQGVLAPPRTALDSSHTWRFYENALLLFNVNSMLIEWISDIHLQHRSLRFPDSPLNTPLGCANLLAALAA
jgi:hypothetical protein